MKLTIEQALDSIRKRVRQYGADLTSYAAADAVRYLAMNWQDAVSDSPAMTTEEFKKMVGGDIDQTIRHLEQLKSEVETDSCTKEKHEANN
jgi:uncharacterized protein YutE (UPF0331/DUF86 family)